MVKTALVVSLCLPLVWIGLREATSLYRSWRSPAPALRAGDAAGIEELRMNARMRREGFTPVKKLIVTLDDAAIDPESTVPARALTGLIKMRGDLGKIVKAARDDEEIARGSIERLVKSLAPGEQPATDTAATLEALRRSIDKYRRSDLHDPTLAQSTELLIDSIDLRRARPDAAPLAPNP